MDKPAGLLVHRTGLDAGETQFALQMLREQLGRPVWPLHRLDKGTSGVLLFALSAEVAAQLAPAFGDGHAIDKHYHAIVRGWPAAQGLIDHPLKRMRDDARHGRLEEQAAQTQFTTLAHYNLPVAQGPYPSTRAALVALHPLTGRRHQLRRHLKHLAHPILGDATHGKGPLNRNVADCLGHARLWLHASQLTFTHPMTQLPTTVEAPLGPEWARWTDWATADTAPCP